MSKKSYKVPENLLENHYEVKRSKFITRVAYAETREQAMTLLDQAVADYPDARHHCWAYQLGNPQQPISLACNDDGEPSGTAGKPMLNVLQHSDLGNIMVIVIRYFGGIKLGAGGLVRAYSSAVQEAVAKLDTRLYIPTVPLIVNCSYAEEPELRRFLATNEVLITDSAYKEQVTFHLQFPEEAINAIKAYCDNRLDVSLADSPNSCG